VLVNRVEELRYLVLAAQREGSRAFADVLRPLGVTPAQAEVLTVVRTATGPLAVREIGELLVCETGSPSRLVTNLITAGLLQGSRDSADGRITRLSLTTAGRQIAAHVSAAEQKFQRQLAANLAEDQALDTVVDFLRHFVANSPTGRAVARRRALEGPAPDTDTPEVEPARLP
jgi:MarR family transcriptional regulator, organic hydroperoxide resistance regulator